MPAWTRYAAPVVLVCSVTAPSYSAIYLGVEQAQRALCPGESLSPFAVKLSPEQRKAIEKASDTRLRKEPRVWRSSGGGWFIVDEVLGKHEFITYAVTLSAGGAVKGIEILEYKESYGYEVREAKWRGQFTGKTASAPLQLDKDIQNISGATLSSRHLTEGIRRMLAFHAAALR